MKPDEMAVLCIDRLNAATQFGQKWDTALITLVTPKGWKPPPKFPRAVELAQVRENGERVRWFNAMNVLAWLTANGFVKLK